MPLDSSIEVREENGRITFKYTVKNIGKEPITLRFRGGNDAEFTVLENGRDVWSSSPGEIGLPVIRHETLGPGESNEYTRQWNDPSPGTYTVEATLTAPLHPVPAESTFSIDETPAPSLRGRLTTSRSPAGVRFDFVVRNTGKTSVELHFPGFERAAYTVYDTAGEVWSEIYEVPHTVQTSGKTRGPSLVPRPGGSTTEEIPAGESTSYSLTWTDPEPGTFTVAAHLLARNASTEAASGFTIPADAPFALEGSLTTERKDGKVVFAYEVKNTESEPVEVTFPTANEADVAAIQDGSELWRWSHEHMSPQVVETRSFDPGESVSYEREWSNPVNDEFTAVATLQAQTATAGATKLVSAVE